MTKVDRRTEAAFRTRIKNEAASWGWTQAMLAARMDPIGNEQTVSRLLNGNRPISAMMAGRLINALGLAGTLENPFLASGPDEADVEKIDRDAERLVEIAAADNTTPPTAEALLITLAYEFAQGSHIDLHTAFQGLRAALQAAAEIKARGELPQNTDDALQRVMQEVARLNDLGDLDAGAAALDEAMK
ncbi:MAG: XRE family transcriptional regulator, partial [Rhodobacteraceae bacterium]|nr:XRE family transcriptional regulator [Paracoccaceae bacterium]